MKKLRLLVSLMTRENDYQIEQAASAQQAGASLGCDVQVIFADNDAITQGTQLLKIIQGDPATRPMPLSASLSAGRACRRWRAPRCRPEFPGCC